MKKKVTIRFLARAGIIAALYAGLTVAFHPISYGPGMKNILDEEIKLLLNE